MRAILKQFFGLLAVYVIALQAVLGVWSVAAQAGTSADPLAILCQTASDGSPGTPDKTPASHRVDCVCASSCAHMSMGALVEAAPLPSSPALAVAIRPPVRIAVEATVAWHGSAQPRAPPIDV